MGAEYHAFLIPTIKQPHRPIYRIQAVKMDVSQNPDYLVYASHQIGTDFTDDEDASTIAFFTDDYEFLCVVVYNGREDQNIGMSIAAATPKWASKSVIKAAFDYPFKQLGLNRVTAFARESNTRSRDMLLRLGFKHEGTMRQYFSTGESCEVYGLTREECRWINGKKE